MPMYATINETEKRHGVSEYSVRAMTRVLLLHVPAYQTAVIVLHNSKTKTGARRVNSRSGPRGATSPKKMLMPK